MSVQDSQRESIRGLAGVWQVKRITRQDVSALTADKPFPNLIMFAHRYYCMIWISGSEPKRPFAKRWNPTNSEKIDRFDSLVVNAGTYEIEGNILIANPLVARIPDFMGGKLICEYYLEEDTMTLRFVDEYSFDGVQAPWVASGGLTLKLVRIE